jgi:hypothetical protein
MRERERERERERDINLFGNIYVYNKKIIMYKIQSFQETTYAIYSYAATNMKKSN